MTKLPIGSVAGALLGLRNKTNAIQEPNALFPIRISPEIAGTPFLPYRVRPKYPNWCGVTLIPILSETPTAGNLGIELVSPDRQILCESMLPLTQVESFKPVYFPFPVIRDSHLGIYELRVIVRDTQSSVRVLESRFLSPAKRLRRWRTRLLSKLTFYDRGSGPDKDQEQSSEDRLASGPYTQNELTLELATSVGSQSLEDHYWCSGWQAANVQLITELKPNDSILDIGCGVGRLAYGLHAQADVRAQA